MKGSRSVIGVFLAWVVTYGLCVWLKPETFLSLHSLELLFRQSMVVGIGAIGMTYVIMLGGIDLSAGSVVAMCTVTGALTLNKTGNLWLAILAAISTGVICGLCNGLLTAKLRVGAFIATLATMLIFRGVGKGLTNELTVSPKDTSWLGVFTGALNSSDRWQLIPVGAWIWIFFLIVMSLASQYTVFGRNVIAIGSNESASRLCGVRIDRVKIATYALAGFFFGVAGLMQFSRSRLGDPTVAGGVELSMIAAAVIGGASLSGGYGSIWGAAIGALIMTTINKGCTSMGYSNWVQEILTGVIIVAAVAGDRWRASRFTH